MMDYLEPPDEEENLCHRTEELNKEQAVSDSDSNICESDSPDHTTCSKTKSKRKKLRPPQSRSKQLAVRKNPKPESLTRRDETPHFRRYKIQFVPKSHDDLLQEQYQQLACLVKTTKNKNHSGIENICLRQRYDPITRRELGGSNYDKMPIVVKSAQQNMLKDARNICGSGTSTVSITSISDSSSSSRISSPLPSDSQQIYPSSRHVSFKPPSPSPHDSNITSLTSRTIDEELARRANQNIKPRCSYRYDFEIMRDDPAHKPNFPKPKKKRIVSKKIDSVESTPRSATSEKSDCISVATQSGIKSDSQGNLKSHSSNLKNTEHPTLKEWLSEKNKVARALVKTKRADEKKKQREAEQAQKELEERKVKAQQAMKEWRAKKRNKLKLVRREKQRLTNLVLDKKDFSADKNNPEAFVNVEKFQPSPDNAQPLPRPFSASRSRNSSEPDSKKVHTQLKSNMKPRTNIQLTQRPMSTPTHKVKKDNIPSQQTLQSIFDNSPDLKEKIKRLELEKRLKHRQSYNDWVQVKDSARNNALQLIRERRVQLEKEIQEETAKVISEAARRHAEQASSERSKKSKKSSSKSPESWQSKLQPTQSNNFPKQYSKLTPKTSNGSPLPILTQMERESSEFTEEPIETKKPVSFRDSYEPPTLRRPKSRLQQSGINGKEFSRFIWDLVNDEEEGIETRPRPEPQGSDEPETLAEKPIPRACKSPTHRKPSKNKNNSEQTNDSTNKPPAKRNISTGTTDCGERVEQTPSNIFSMTSVEA